MCEAAADAAGSACVCGGTAGEAVWGEVVCDGAGWEAGGAFDAGSSAGAEGVSAGVFAGLAVDTFAGVTGSVRVWTVAGSSRSFT